MRQNGAVLYIKGDKNKVIEKTDVQLGDVLSMECSDPAIVRRVKTIHLFRVSEKARIVVSVLEIIAKIHEMYPELTIENMGESDLIVTVEKKKKEKKLISAVKSGFVLLVTFIGAGFSIMSFNNDVNVPKLFDQIYYMVTGSKSDGFTILELTYCLGMSIGILLFFNHFGKRRFTVDPTPMEVEMRTYEEDIEKTLIDDYSRKGKEKDVG